MEYLSSVATIVRIAQDIAGAVATVSRNRNRCRMLATRVQGIGDLMQELHGSGEAGAGTTDTATRRLLGRLEDALRRALLLVRSCRDISCPLSLLAGGRQADQFNEVDGEIDRCLLDLGVANRILIARLERLLLQYQNFKDDCAKDDDHKMEKVSVEGDSDKKKEPEPTGGGEKKHRVHTVNAGTHELVPPPSYGYGYWPYTQGLGTGGCYHDGAGAPSDAAAYYHHHVPYPDMFSDENPHACAII